MDMLLHWTLNEDGVLRIRIESQSKGVVTASQDAEQEQVRQRHQILEIHLQKIWHKWKL